MEKTITLEEKISYITSECWFAEWKVGFAEVVNLLDEESSIVLLSIPSRGEQSIYKHNKFYDRLPKLALEWGEFLAPLSEQGDGCIDFIYDLLMQYKEDKKFYTAK